MRKSIHTGEYAALRAALREARAHARLSQRELASRLRVPHSWVAKVESGERRLDLVEFSWFIRACDLDPLVAFTRLSDLSADSKSQTRNRGRGGRTR